MLKKTRSGEAGKAKVTFVLAPQANADHVHVVGDFNGWQAATPMKRQKDGSWRATVELQPAREYQFRYLVDGNVWVNDEAADAYVPNPFGVDNCVVRTPETAAGTRSGAGARRTGRAGAGSSQAAGTHAPKGTADKPASGKGGSARGASGKGAASKGDAAGRGGSGRAQPREE